MDIEDRIKNLFSVPGFQWQLEYRPGGSLFEVVGTPQSRASVVYGVGKTISDALDRAEEHLAQLSSSH